MHKKTRTIFDYIITQPGITQKQIADATGRSLPHVGASVATLRKHGLVEDVARRCDYCGCAQTRGIPNQGLYATQQGRTFYKQVVG